MTVSLTLCDLSADMVKAWRGYFPDDTGTRIVNQNIVTLSDVDALVVPANSFGFTDGGVDQAISKTVFDWQLQEKLHTLIEHQYYGELLVGQAGVLPTSSTHFRYVIIAPTMRVPSDVHDTVNAYLAMRGILLAANAHNRAMRDQPADRIHSLAVPGLCTGIGQMPAERAAFQMWEAYRAVVIGNVEMTMSLERQVAQDRKMRERA